MNKIEKMIVSLSSIMGKIVMIIFTSAKNAFKIVLETIIPFLIFVTIMFTLITKTGVGSYIAQGLSGLASSPIGLIVLGLIITFPLISPIVGPGAVIQQIIGTLIGGLISTGAVPLSMALPAVFAIHQPAGSDFIPVGMSLAEAQPETVEIGVPAVLYSKFIIAPIEIGLAVIVGMLLFK
jgi:PTS system glucitol/sorbitol-specific IIB component